MFPLNNSVYFLITADKGIDEKGANISDSAAVILVSVRLCAT